MRPDMQIIARARNESSEPKLLRAGANRVVNPQQLGGDRMAAFVTQPHVVDFVDVVMHDGTLEFRLEELSVSAGSPLTGNTLRSVQLHDRTGALILAIRRPDGSFVTNPSPEVTIEAGDILIGVGTAAQLDVAGAVFLARLSALSPGVGPSRRWAATGERMPSKQKATAASPASSAGRSCSNTSTRARRSVTPRMAWARTRGSSRRIMLAGDARLHVGEGVGHGLLLALADERGEALLGPGELEQDEEMAVGVEPPHRCPDASLDAAHRVGLVGDGLALCPAEVPLRVGQDLAQQLLFGGEVPVEDALAHAEAVDDVGHRCRVVSLGGELPGCVVEQFEPAPLPPCGQPACHRPNATCGARHATGCTTRAFRRATCRALPWGVAYWVLKVLLSPIFYLVWRIKVEGRDHVPDTGPVILAPNHVTFLDSMFLPLVLRRRVTFVAKAEYFDSWKTAWFFRACGQIPMRREGGSASERALAAARDVLTSGKVLGIYPEGTRSPDGRLYQRPHRRARLALGCGVPIVPVGLVGTSVVQRPGLQPAPSIQEGHGALRRPARPVALRGDDGAGDPMTLRAATDELMFEIRNLSGQDYVDRYAKRHGVVGGADVAHVRASTNGDGDGDGQARDPVPPMSPEPARAGSEPAT